MVFVRQVGRIFRPSLLGRCIAARPCNTANPVSIAAFPANFSGNRSAFSTSTGEMTTAASGETIKNKAAMENSQFTSTLGNVNAGNSIEMSEEGSEISLKDSARIATNIREVLANGKSASMATLETLFHELAMTRDFPMALALIKEMRAGELKPNTIIYSQAARAGRRSLKAREIRRLFGEEIIPPNASSHQDAEAEQIESPVFAGMQELLELMKADGVELDVLFYNDLAFGLAINNQGGLLINVAVAMEKRGLQPSTYFYNKMLHTLPRCGLSDRADVLFSRMVLNNLADQISYAVRIGTLVYLSRLADAEVCFKDMCKLYGPTEVACNSIINGYLNQRRLDDALEVLDMMKSNPNCRPSNVTANTFLSYYYTTGDLVSASGVLEYFARAISFPIQSRDYANMLKLFARHDQPRAKQMMETIMKRTELVDVELYNALLQILNDRQVLLPFRLTMARILVPTNIAITSAETLAALCVNTGQEFRQLIAHMEKRGVVPNSLTFDLVMKALRARNDYDAAIAVYRRVPLGSMSNAVRNHYLAALISKGLVEDIKIQVKSMNERRQPIYEYNLNSLSQMGIEVAVRNRLPNRREASRVPALDARI